MAIRPSAASDIARLVAALSSTDAVARESASARLAILGKPAVPSLVALARQGDAEIPARRAAIRTLAATGGAAVVRVAGDLLTGAVDELAIEAVELCRTLLNGPEPHATTAFEHLTSLVLDLDASVERRLAAIAALEGMPDDLMAPLYDALAGDPAPRVVARVVRKQAGLTSTFDDMVERGFQEPPEVVLQALQADAEDAGLTRLGRGLDLARRRARERAPESPAWLLVRAAIHQVLGVRGSRLALDDLRSALDACDSALPPAFLTAAAAIGDAGCLKPIARAWVAAADTDRRWRDRLATTFAAIVKHERLTRQHPVMREILGEMPAAGVLVASAPRRRTTRG